MSSLTYAGKHISIYNFISLISRQITMLSVHRKMCSEVKHNDAYGVFLACWGEVISLWAMNWPRRRIFFKWKVGMTLGRLIMWLLSLPGLCTVRGRPREQRSLYSWLASSLGSTFRVSVCYCQELVTNLRMRLAWKQCSFIHSHLQKSIQCLLFPFSTA